MSSNGFHFTPPPENSRGTTFNFLVPPTQLTFVVEGKQIQVETRFLIQCDYFNNMLKNPMTETLTGRIEIKECSMETLQIFLNFLKEPQLPNHLNNRELLELYTLVHRFQYSFLLKQVRDLLIKQIPSSLPDILIQGFFFSDEVIVNQCKEQVSRNSYQYRNLLLELTKAEEYDLIGELCKWPRDSIYSMFTYSENGETPFSKLVSQNMVLSATNLLKAAKANNIRISQIVPRIQQTILQILSQETPPNENQIELLMTLALDEPSALTSSHQAENSPLFAALNKGWNTVFERMLTVCQGNIPRLVDPKGVGLLFQAISLRRILAIQAIKAQSTKQSIYSSEHSIYVLEAIRTKQVAIVEEILTFPVQGQSQSITWECVQAAIETKDLKILKAIWPYYKGSIEEISKLRMKVFESNQFDMAEIVFSGEFDASKEIYPGHKKMTWLHHVAKSGELRWLEFMAARSKDKNAKVELSYQSYSKPIGTTPLMLALWHLRDFEFISKMLELEFDPNIGSEAFSPIHLAFKNKKVLKCLLEYRPNLSVKNQNDENFFHLYFKSSWTLKDFSDLVAEADTEVLVAQNNEGHTPLHLALLNETTSRLADGYHIFAANSLVLWKTNKQNKPPLRVKDKAFESNLNFFIEVAVKLKTQPPLRHLLLWCAQNYLYSFCEKLIPAIENIQTITVVGGKNLLHIAAESGACKAVTRLVELKIPIDSVDNQLRTPLRVAVEKQNAEMVEMLLSLKASPEKLDSHGETPLSYALKHYPQPRTEEAKKIIRALENGSCPIQ